jgi:hypothetical protein
MLEFEDNNLVSQDEREMRKVKVLTLVAAVPLIQ